MILSILEELRATSKTNEKLAILKREIGNDLLKRVLKMTYDNVAFTYGITVPQVEKFEPEIMKEKMLEEVLDLLEQNIASREITGHDALQYVSSLIATLDEGDGDLIKKIINRDLRINVGKTQINKVWKGLIIRPVYMRCGVYGEKTVKNIGYPAFNQLKADGTYREFHVQNNVVTSRSRSGEAYEYPIIFETMSWYPDGVYVGELTVRGIQDRSEGNGLINSSEPPHEDIIAELWDYVTLDEYEQAAKKDRKNPCVVPYEDRWNALGAIVKGTDEGSNVGLIDSHIVNNLREALILTSEYMNDGLEGAILKDMGGVFKDGDSKHQLKLKIKIDGDMRIVAFHDGKVGTKREGKVGSLIFENDEGTIKGRTSGFTDKQMDEFTENKDKYLGRVITVQFNDLTKGEGNDYHALSHPRFIEVRDDKDETDTLEKVFELRDMAINLTE